MKISLFFILLSTLIISDNCKQPNIFVYINNVEIDDFYLVYNDGEILSFLELYKINDNYIKVTIVFKNNQKFEFKNIPRLELVNCKTAGFDLQDTTKECTQIIKSQGGALRVIGNRDVEVDSCEQFNILMLHND